MTESLIVIVIVVAAVAGIAIAVAILSRRKQAAAEALATAAHERSVAADARAAAADERWIAADDRAAAADDRAATADAQRDQAREEAAVAAEAQRAADVRTAAAEQRGDDVVAALESRDADGASDAVAIDAHVLWALEQARSERTWRHSVAIGPESESVFTDAADPLREALQVELDAAREDVGAVVELEADLPEGITKAGCMLTLRAAQELLADVVRRAEETTLVVRADGRDLVVTVRAIGEDGEPVASPTLTIPPSTAMVPIDGGVRVRNAITV